MTDFKVHYQYDTKGCIIAVYFKPIAFYEIDFFMTARARFGRIMFTECGELLMERSFL